MAKTVYKATCPDGTVIKRTTERVYVAAVIAQESYGFALNQADKPWAYDVENWQFACKMAASGSSGIEQTARYQAQASKYSSAEAAAAGKIAERVEAVQMREANGDFEEWQLIGFCGRPDLAAKTAAKAQGGRWADVRIVPAIAV